MSPFLQFRAWLRSGPTPERVLTAAIGVLLVSLVAWASTPLGGGASQRTLASEAGAPVDSGTPAGPSGSSGPAGAGSPVPGTTGRGSSGAAPTGSSPAGTAGSLAGPSGRGSSTTGGTTVGPTLGGGGGTSTGSACGPLTSTDQGVTATTLTVGVLLVDLGQAGGLLSIPSADDQQKAYKAVIDDLNEKGGIRCRRVAAKYYRPNPLDSTAEHAACLQMAEDKVFAVFNNLVSPTEQTCIAKAGIPNIWYTAPHTPDVRKYAPYILSWQADFDALIHQYVFASKGLGFFSGMKKLGILREGCYPDEYIALAKELRAVGIDPDKASQFNYGCAPLSSPQEEQAAVLQFQREGVTHVINVAYAHDNAFSRAADQQGFDPKFTHMEDASAAAIESASQKPGRSFDDTLLITTTETGAANTPGYRFNKPTQDCTKLLASVGLPSAYSPGLNSLFGVACINAQMLKAMAEKAPELKRKQLSTGLSRTGPMELPYPAGPIHITDPGRPTSGKVWRPGVWKSACQCWRVTSAIYRSTY